MGKKEFNSDYFYVPNVLVDEVMAKVGTRGVALYVVLARYPSFYDYPSALELSSLLKVSQQKIRVLMEQLKTLDLLNEHDLRIVLGEEEVV